MNSPHTERATLRRVMQTRLRAVSAADAGAWSSRIVDLIRALPEFAAAEAVLFFAPMADAGEVEIDPLALAAISAGKTVAYPLMQGSVIEQRIVRDLSRDLAAGPGRFRQPTERCVPVSLDRFDLILVPGLAYDRAGNRLGRGGGFYDRLLAGPMCRGLTVAPAYSLQVVNEVPSEPHDFPVARVVTEREILIGSAGRIPPGSA